MYIKSVKNKHRTQVGGAITKELIDNIMGRYSSSSREFDKNRYVEYAHIDGIHDATFKDVSTIVDAIKEGKIDKLLTDTKKKADAVAKAAAEAQAAQEKDKYVCIVGASGVNADDINGLYKIDGTVYRKKDNGRIKLRIEQNSAAGLYAWVIRKGKSDQDVMAIMRLNKGESKNLSELVSDEWMVVTTKADLLNPSESNQQQLKLSFGSAAQAVNTFIRSDIGKRVQRTQLRMGDNFMAEAVLVSGATGTNAGHINLIFVPSRDISNTGRVVYRCEDHDIGIKLLQHANDNTGYIEWVIVSLDADGKIDNTYASIATPSGANLPDFTNVEWQVAVGGTRAGQQLHLEFGEVDALKQMLLGASEAAAAAAIATENARCCSRIH